jgi:hypothetical protein
MKSTASLVGLAAALLAAGPAPVPRLHADGLEPLVRTVHVTVTDGQGAAVPDLTPADFTNRGLNVSLKRRGVSLRAPSLVPDR